MDTEQIQNILLRALNCAHAKYLELGTAGLEEVQKNQFGETALRMDIEAEAAVINSFRADNFPVRVISEEHGTVDIGTPQYLAVLDGIDGTALYRKDYEHGKYGTMLAIFSNTNPTYLDYICTGISQHAATRTLVATKDLGVTVWEAAEHHPVHVAAHSDLSKSTKIYIDEYWETNRNTFSIPLSGYNTNYYQCSAMYYADIAEGIADFALECTRKGNLEIAVSYGLVREAGGVTMDLAGTDIGPNNYLEFGQTEHVPIITATSAQLAEQMRNIVQHK